jgi:uncharacterized DUF497 family protein
MALIFEWDDQKAKKNQRKHKVNFEEAKTVFGDPLLVSFTNITQTRKSDLSVLVHRVRTRFYSSLTQRY